VVGGVVLAASYEAEAFEVYGAWRDRQRASSQVTFVSGHFKDYRRMGGARSGDRRYTPACADGAWPSDLGQRARTKRPARIATQAVTPDGLVIDDPDPELQFLALI